MIINVTAHPITFQSSSHLFNDEDSIECILCGRQLDENKPCVYTIQPCGIIINARPVEEHIETHPSGAELVRTKFEPDPESEEALIKLEKENPYAIIVGSVIAAQAFPGRVFAMVPVPGFERVPPAEKRMRDDKFTSFAPVLPTIGK